MCNTIIAKQIAGEPAAGNLQRAQDLPGFVERLQKLWSEAGTITESIRALEISAGINQESKEAKKEAIVVNKRPFSPESVADEIGELAGKRS